jgi:hypothetical protein
MALVLANSVAANDLASPVLDDVTRAAVELTDFDVQILKEVRQCESQRNG